MQLFVIILIFKYSFTNRHSVEYFPANESQPIDLKFPIKCKNPHFTRLKQNHFKLIDVKLESDF